MRKVKLKRERKTGHRHCIRFMLTLGNAAGNMAVISAHAERKFNRRGRKGEAGKRRRILEAVRVPVARRVRW